MSLTITIDRTEGGRFRALVAEQPRLVIEHDKLSELVEDLKRNLDLIGVMPDGRLSLFQAKVGNQADDTAVRAEIERTAPRNEELDELIDRYPVPVEWGNDPGGRMPSDQRGPRQSGRHKRSAKPRPPATREPLELRVSDSPHLDLTYWRFPPRDVLSGTRFSGFANMASTG